jgi:hypothetical protein
MLAEAEKAESKFNSDLCGSKASKLKNFQQKIKTLKTTGKFNLISEKVNSITVCGENTCTFLDFYRGKPVLYYLIKKANKDGAWTYLRLFCFVFGFVRGYIPSCLFLGEIEFFPGDTTFEKIVFFIMNTSLIMFYSYMMRFIV